jgi:hypothetical protein
MVCISGGRSQRVAMCDHRLDSISAHEGGKVVSCTHLPPLPLRKYFWYSFLLEAESDPRAIVRPEGLSQ